MLTRRDSQGTNKGKCPLARDQDKHLVQGFCLWSADLKMSQLDLDTF